MKVFLWLAGIALAFVIALWRISMSEAWKKTVSHRTLIRWWTLHIWPRRQKGDDRVFSHLRNHGVEIRTGPVAKTREDWVYWPVTLREMTVIHRAQCCVLRLLKASGFRICLVLFDCEQDPEESEKLSRRFLRQANEIICDRPADDVARAKIDRCERLSLLWKKRKAPLSGSAEKVLRHARVDEFLAFLNKDYKDKNVQMKQTVWQFISPAIQCAVLEHVMKDKNVYVLGGGDELNMWGFLGRDAQDKPNLSQIAISRLNKPPAKAGGPQVDMKTDDELIRWPDDEALRRTLAEYEYPDSPQNTGNLFVWLVNHFCCIPDPDEQYTLGSYNFKSVKQLFEDLASRERKEELIASIVAAVGPLVIR